MKKLSQNEQGIAHLLIVVAFVLLIGGVAGFSYMKIQDKNNKPVASTSQPASSEDADADDQDISVGDEANTESDPAADLSNGVQDN